MYWNEFLAIALAHLFAVASPGPDFAIVTRQTVSFGRYAGLWTSLGVGSGILLHVSYCLLGVALLLSQSPSLFTTVKWIAAAYLLYLGIRSVAATFKARAPAPSPDPAAAAVRPARAFVMGFLTNGLNPKATLFFLALFTVVIDVSTPVRIQVLYGIYLAVATFVWFAMLSTVLGRDSVRGFMLRAGHWFERAMGIVLIFLAVQIAIAS
ncbi:MAG: LysE family transporter [Gammaproteobacteria bacterium]